ncbi:MAG: glutamine--fructose-6-phosphate transaminase (isomerizing), partial [Candidatus Heimdallarchaeota archaeon]|nr:glutamine--fructose-6-phosphate transaminase (isomerizing) [Candidatus Heimdallarchaeota archaeon]
VVHNGIIENHSVLRQQQQSAGFTFTSDTDTEVAVHQIEHYLKQDNDLLSAVKKSVADFEGAYALGVVSISEPGRLIATRSGSPLVIGLGLGEHFIASDASALLPVTRRFIYLEEGDVADIRADELVIYDNNGQCVEREVHESDLNADATGKNGYRHYMLKEIHEQPNSLADYIRIKQPAVRKIAEKIYEAEKVFLLAAGTAHYSTLTGENLIRKYAKKLCSSIISSEYETIRPLVDENTVILPVSQSGETMDTIMAIKDAKKSGAKILSAVNVIGSSITRHSDEVLYLYAGPEIGVAATKTYTAQTLSMWDIGLEIGKISGELGNNEYDEARKLFKKIPSVVKQTIVRSEALTNRIASWFAEKNSSFYLGRGINLQTAKEGALKMKEIAYIHSEAYPAGESKHGPIALIEEDYPVVFVAPKDQTHKRMIGSIMEMKARGATTIGVIEEGDKEIGELVKWKMEIPKGYSELITTIPYVMPMQLLAYYTAMRKGCAIDTPKNLSKSVTVL